MEHELHPVVRPARLSRSFALVPVLLGPALIVAAVAYGAGRFDARPNRCPLAPPAATALAQADMIVNVAPGVTDLAPLVKLNVGERMLEINGLAATQPTFDGLVFDQRVAGQYFDITTTERRIVVLFH